MSELPFTGRTVAVTGASGSLGQALLQELQQQGAALVALTSGESPLDLRDSSGNAIPFERVRWSCGDEQALESVLQRCDVLVINHGFNSHADRSAVAVARSLEVNALSSWRLLELFAEVAGRDPADRPARDQPRRDLGRAARPRSGRA